MRTRFKSIFLVAAIVSMSAWVVVVASGMYAAWGLVATVTGTIFLALWALMRSDWHHMESRLIVSALFLCAFADFILGSGPFIAGMVSFMVVQVLFCIIFLRQIRPRRPSWLPFLAWIAFSLVMLGFYILPAIHDGIMKAGVIIYSTFLICTASLGADAWLNAVKRNKMRDRFAALGGGMFLLSDMLIGMTQFKVVPITLQSAFIMMAFYWGALICITLSVAEKHPSYKSK
jgi:uncharacterized membrane protein YhhN